MKPASWTPPVWIAFSILAGSLIYLMVQWRMHPVPGSEIVAPIILLGSGLVVCAMLEGITYLSSVGLKGETNQHLAPEASQALTRATSDLVRIFELALAVPFALGAVLGVGHKGGVLPLFPVISFLSIGLAIFVGCRRLLACADDLRSRGFDKGLEGWNGIIYSNKSDPRVWVPKFVGVGYTLNFAHARSWVILALLVSPALIVAFLGLIVKLWS